MPRCTSRSEGQAMRQTDAVLMCSINPMNCGEINRMHGMMTARIGSPAVRRRLVGADLLPIVGRGTRAVADPEQRGRPPWGRARHTPPRDRCRPCYAPASLAGSDACLPEVRHPDRAQAAQVRLRRRRRPASRRDGRITIPDVFDPAADLLAAAQHTRRAGRVDSVDERDLGSPAYGASWTVASRSSSPAWSFPPVLLQAGRMFWLTWKKFCGSYLDLISASRW